MVVLIEGLEVLHELVYRGLQAPVELCFAPFQRPEEGHRAPNLDVAVDTCLAGRLLVYQQLLRFDAVGSVRAFVDSTGESPRATHHPPTPRDQDELEFL